MFTRLQIFRMWTYKIDYIFVRVSCQRAQFIGISIAIRRYSAMWTRNGTNEWKNDGKFETTQMDGRVSKYTRLVARSRKNDVIKRIFRWRKWCLELSVTCPFQLSSTRQELSAFITYFKLFVHKQLQFVPTSIVTWIISLSVRYDLIILNQSGTNEISGFDAHKWYQIQRLWTAMVANVTMLNSEQF